MSHLHGSPPQGVASKTWVRDLVGGGDPSPIFGYAVDGDLTFDGTSAVTVRGQTLFPYNNGYTLNVNISADTLTINSGVVLETNGRLVQCRRLINNGTIRWNGMPGYPGLATLGGLHAKAGPLAPVTATTITWSQVAMSADGSKILACYQATGKIFRSLDAGRNWEEIQPNGAGIYSWTAVFVSGDGLVMLAGLTAGRLFRSTDGGRTWAEVQPGGVANYNWISLAGNYDGSVLLVAATGKRVYKWASGAWSEVAPTGTPGDLAWMHCAVSSDDGSHMSVIGGGADDLYISTNTGASWATVTPTGSMKRCFPTSDGAKWVAVGQAGNFVYISTDDGSNWTPKAAPLAGISVAGFAIATTGGETMYLAGGGAGNNWLYKSTDGGDTWSSAIQPIGPYQCTLQWLSCDADGSDVAIGYATTPGYLMLSRNGAVGWTVRMSQTFSALYRMCVSAVANGSTTNGTPATAAASCLAVPDSAYYLWNAGGGAGASAATPGIPGAPPSNSLTYLGREPHYFAGNPLLGITTTVYEAGFPGNGGSGGSGFYGGGGGMCGGLIVICAREISGVGVIEANGGDGGAGQYVGAQNTGGGGGGSGGSILIYTQTPRALSGQTCNVLGGAGGASGLGTLPLAQTGPVGQVRWLVAA